MTIAPRFWGWTTSPLTTFFWGWEQAEDLGVIFAYRGSRVVHAATITSTVVRHDLPSKITPVVAIYQAIQWEPVTKVVQFDFTIRAVRSSFIGQAIIATRIAQVVGSTSVAGVVRHEGVSRTSHGSGAVKAVR